MFSRNKRRDGDKAKAAVRPAAAPSLISHDLRVIGDLISEGDVQVDGIVEGDVRSRNVTIGEGAIVKGSIAAEKARIRGHVEGEITARSVALSKSATVQGDVLHEQISIEAGAYIDGRCRRFDEQAAIEDHSNEARPLEGPKPEAATDGVADDDKDETAVNPFAAAGRSAKVIDNSDDDKADDGPEDDRAEIAPDTKIKQAAGTA